MAADVSSVDTSKAERSPSPPLAPPTPSAPGPRATALQKLYADAIAHILKTNSYSNFAACFPTPAREIEPSMRALHEQFNAKLSESMKTHFDSILEQRNVVRSLNDLDRLVEEARRRKNNAEQDGGINSSPSPPHSLPPRALYLSHLSPSLAQHSAAISSKQDTVQSENVEILGRVMQQRNEISALVRGLEAEVADLDASVAALKPEEMEALREDVKGVDLEMGMSA